MNVEIGAEAALFPEKEYINGIAVAVWDWFVKKEIESRIYKPSSEELGDQMDFLLVLSSQNFDPVWKIL
jgi:hypothetical protein